jgi:hypothetical protein
MFLVSSRKWTGPRGDRPIRNFTRTVVYSQYSGSKKLLHACIISVIIKQHLLQNGRKDGPVGCFLSILAVIQLALKLKTSKEIAQKETSPEGENSMVCIFRACEWVYLTQYIN